MKRKLLICFGVLALAIAIGSNFSDLSAQSQENLSMENPGGGSYAGPVCQNTSGTYYCCKNSSGSCDKPDSCPSCQ